MIPLAGLFLAAFLAATPVPFQSEVVFLGLQAVGWSALTLVVVASVGNVLGSVLTYALGRGLGGLRDHPRFPIRPAQLARAEGWFARWGLWSLLLSWAPGGDLVVFVSGLLRAPLSAVILLLIVAKTGRYLALAWAGGAALSYL